MTTHVAIGTHKVTGEEVFFSVDAVLNRAQRTELVARITAEHSDYRIVPFGMSLEEMLSE
jgi:hypothetical protein